MVTIPDIAPQNLKFHAQHYQQGGRDVYALAMNLETLNSILPKPPPEASQKIVGSNRRFYLSHARTIADYLYNEDKWVLGSIVLGIDPRYVDLKPYPHGKEGESSNGLGVLHIPVVGGLDSIEILDGQHRRMAIHQVLKKLDGEITDLQKTIGMQGKSVGKRLAMRIKKLDGLKNMSIPVSIFVEPEEKCLKQMWSDLGHIRKPDPITLARFNERDPFNRAATELEELSHSGLRLLSGRIEMERSTPPLDSDNLLSLNQLSRCLTILRYGFGSRVSRARFRKAQRGYDEIVNAGIVWADEFLPNARTEYEALCSIEIEDGYVSNNRAQFLAYSVTMLQILSGCLYEWNKHNLPTIELANWLRDADIDPKSEECIFLRTGALVHGESSLQGGRRPSTVNTINYIVKHALEANGHVVGE